MTEEQQELYDNETLSILHPVVSLPIPIDHAPYHQSGHIQSHL